MTFASTRSLALLGLLLTLAACNSGGGSNPVPPPPPPTVTSVAPTHGTPGTPIVLTGTNLTGVSAVSFNGMPAFSFSSVNSTTLDAVVPGNAPSGAILVTTLNGQASSPAFTVDPALTPTVTAISPTAFGVGSVVTVTGTHLIGASHVKFNGVDAAAFNVASDTQLLANAPAGLSAGAITVTTAGGTATGPTYTVTTSSSAQVLMNGGFEQSSPVIWQGSDVIYANQDATYTAHGGTHFAYLGGYGTVKSDQITQDLYIPATATAATATFYLKIITDETGLTATDSFTVAALSTSGTTLATLLTRSNLNAAGYTAYSVSLLPFKGQAVRLSFKSQEDAQNQTSFLLDDVAVNITVPTATDLKPLITSFTPTTGLAGVGSVQITGGNFFGVTAVTIGGASSAFTLTDGTSLKAPIPATAAFGNAPISITNAQGTGTSAANFSVTYGAPAISGVNPTQGPAGTPVVITGSYLGYPGTTLALNGAAIPTFTSTATQISFTVPATATSGNLVVTTPGGAATSPSFFTITSAGTTLDFHIEKVQLTQSTQTLDNSVPIVAGKPGLIRVFVLANQPNGVMPAVRVTLRNNGVTVPTYPQTVTAPGASVPTALDESSLLSSWNVPVAAADLTTPLGSGYSILAEADPGSLIQEVDKTNNTFTTTNLVGTAVPTFKTTIFPVVLNSGTGNVTAANKDTWAARLIKMYPVGLADVAVSATTFTDATITTLGSDGTGWDTLLSDLATKHQADGATDRYYFGALHVSYSNGVAGLGYIGSTSPSSFAYRTAIGWDKTGYSDGGNYPEVFAHETGHNMGRNHSPCPATGNVPAGIDPNYPYPGASIGVWGYDSTLNALYSPATYKDVMAYCSPVWASDYTYKGILNFRAGGGFLVVGAEDAPLPKALATAQDCLLARGIVHEDGRVELLPAFRTRALPTAPVGAGEYTLAGLDAKGAALFTAPIELVEVGCSPKRERHFLLALPYDATLLDAVAGLSVLKGDQVLASQKAATATMAITPELLRLSEDQVQATWDASVHPTVLVRDAASGEVVAILSGGQKTFASKAKRFDLVLSDGVSGRTHRLELPH